MKKYEKILNNYLDYKKISVRRESKILSIRSYVKKFLDFVKNVDKCTEQKLIEFLNECNKKYGVSTMNDIKVFLKNFIRWYFVDYSSRFRNLDKLCRNETPPKRYTSQDMLSKEEVEKIIKKEPSMFWKAYFSVLFYGGMRPTEVCELKWKDIEFSEEGDAFITIYSKKNKKSFMKCIPQNVTFYLKEIKDNDSEWVFPSPQKKARKGQPITQKSVYTRLIPLGKKALGKHVNPYKIRHSVASIHYQRDDLKDDITAHHMGHSKSMKETYNHLSRDKLREQARKIWINTENLPPEKKEEYEKRIKELEEWKEELQNYALGQGGIKLKKLLLK